MKHKRSTTSGTTVIIDAKAEAIVNGRTASTATFDDDLEDSLFLPRDTNGIVRLTVTVDFPLPGTSNAVVTCGVKAQWIYTKRGAQIVFVQSAFTQSGGDDGLAWSVSAKPSSTDHSVSASFSVTIKGSVLEDDESMDFAVTVDTLPSVDVTVDPRVWVKQDVEFVPFATNQANRLEKGDLTQQVRQWYQGLNPIAQQMVEKAITANDMPGGEAIVIEGYTSTLGPETYNFGLGWNRAQAVMGILRMVTGNNNPSIFRTPSVGEGKRATDKKTEENNDPQWRKVVVKYWNMYDTRVPI
jgi:outer membrane protein OmpA-like peptidoglycan-associated protein